ncbi:MAG: xylulokinase [Lachnospiraceae bacterium]|nr:xylulokinase [Lachnospiraceae bacterium]
MLFVGIDLGTSAVKLLLMNEKGEIQKIASREYPLYFPRPGWSEQNPTDWYDKTIDGLKELLSDCDKSQVAGISFGGQMHGLVVLDERDQVIRPAILWNDGRSEKQVEYLNQQIGKDKISQYTANIAFAGFTAPKILWMREEEPENFARIHRIMLPKDYLAYRLSGSFVTDVSDASGMLLMDVKNRCWSKEMLSLCGIIEDQLPELHESYEVVGALLPKVAAELGLDHKVKVIAGAGDNAAAAVGTGTVGDGACNISLGTSGTLFISNHKFGVDPNNALHSFAHADGHYHLMGCMLSAASCNKWWMDEILRDSDYVGVQKDIDKLGENHVYFLPYLMGERSPHNDPLARGAFVGMSMDTTRADMVQSIFEGVAFGLRDSLEVARQLEIPLTSTRICGGGAKSPLWCKMIANILNLKVERIAVEEGPALGAAMLAAVGCGVFPSVEEAAQAIVRVVDVIQPKPDLVEKYQDRYQTFRQLYPALKEIYRQI